jgi:hypothetical protein
MAYQSVFKMLHLYATHSQDWLCHTTFAVQIGNVPRDNLLETLHGLHVLCLNSGRFLCLGHQQKAGLPHPERLHVSWSLLEFGRARTAIRRMVLH